MGLLPHMFSMWCHPQESSHLVSAPSVVYVSTRYHTPAALMPFLTKFSATLFPITTKTTYDVAISPSCLLSLMVWGFASHLTWVGFTIPSFYASNSSRIFCSPSVPFPMYCVRETVWIFSLSQDSFCSTSITPLLTILAAVITMSQYCRAISALAFGWVIAVIAPLALVWHS